MQLQSAAQLLPLLLISSLNACAPHAPGIAVDNSMDSSSPSSSELSTNAFVEAASSAQFFCKDPIDCPPAVGMVMFVDSSGFSGQCTGSLLGPDLVVTNSHCIPNNLKVPGADCTKSLAIKFASSNNVNMELSFCSKVVMASPISENDKIGDEPDYAFFRIGESITDRSPLTLNFAGVEQQQRLEIEKVDPIDNVSFGGILGVFSCASLEQTTLVPHYLDAFSPVLGFSECSLKPGNSGAPVVDRKGQVRALIHAVFDSKDYEDTLERKRDSASRLGFREAPGIEDDSETTRAPFAIATNVACMTIPDQPPRQLPASCSQHTQSLGKAKLEAVHDQIQNQALNEIRSLLSKNPIDPRFEWTLGPIVIDHFGHLIVSPEPKCFLRPETWLKHDTEKVGLKNSLRSVIVMPSWSVHVFTDRDFRYVAKRVDLDDEKDDLLFFPGTLSQKLESEVILSNPDYGVKFDKILKPCLL